jgi:hypothetical protein
VWNYHEGNRILIIIKIFGRHKLVPTLCYAPAKCGKFDVSLCFFQFCYRYLEIWHLLFVPHRTYTNRDGDSLFLPFCTIGISMYQKRILPYIIIPSTFSPQAYSLLLRSRQTDRFQHPLLPKFFFFGKIGDSYSLEVATTAHVHTVLFSCFGCHQKREYF